MWSVPGVFRLTNGRISRTGDVRGRPDLLKHDGHSYAVIVVMMSSLHGVHIDVAGTQTKVQSASDEGSRDKFASGVCSILEAARGEHAEGLTEEPTTPWDRTICSTWMVMINSNHLVWLFPAVMMDFHAKCCGLIVDLQIMTQV